MTLLPIQFWTKLNKEEFGELKSFEILDLIENYLVEENFNYVKRKKDKIVFHKADGWNSFNVKSFLVSGIIKTKKSKGSLIIVNGNWMVFLIAIPFLIFLLLANSNFSTLDKNDMEVIQYFFIVIFGGNLIIRIIAHLNFKTTIKNLVKKNYTQLSA